MSCEFGKSDTHSHFMYIYIYIYINVCVGVHILAVQNSLVNCAVSVIYIYYNVVVIYFLLIDIMLFCLQYAAFLLLVFLLEAVVGILAYMYKSSVSTTMSIIIMIRYVNVWQCITAPLWRAVVSFIISR